MLRDGWNMTFGVAKWFITSFSRVYGKYRWKVETNKQTYGHHLVDKLNLWFSSQSLVWNGWCNPLSKAINAWVQYFSWFTIHGNLCFNLYIYIYVIYIYMLVNSLCSKFFLIVHRSWLKHKHSPNWKQLQEGHLGMIPLIIPVTSHWGHNNSSMQITLIYPPQNRNMTRNI